MGRAGGSKMKKYPIFLICGLFIFLIDISFSNTIVRDTCPDKFEGSVLKMVDNDVPLSNLLKVNVTFEIEKIIRGNLQKYKTISVIKYANHNFQVGKRYLLELRDNKICSIKAIR